MGRKVKFRKALSMSGLLAEMRCCFEGGEDEVAGRGLNSANGSPIRNVRTRRLSA